MINFSEVIPRNDNRDSEVITCNNLLNSYATNQDDVYIARHANLRDKTYSCFRDNKHIRETKIARFAANLKFALRKAYGIESSRPKGDGFHYNSCQARNIAPPPHGNASNRPMFQNNSGVNERLMALAASNNRRGELQGSSNVSQTSNTNKDLQEKIVKAFTHSLGMIFGT